MRDDYPSEVNPLARYYTDLSMGKGTVAAAVLIAIVLAIVGLIWFLTGSSSPTSNRANNSAQANDSGEELARQTLARHTDLNSCRTALQQINSEMTEKPSLRSPALTENQKTWLREHINLDKGELSEVESGSYTRLDGAHLERCFLMRDAARVLEVKGVRRGDEEVREKPLDQAVRAFAWVMRQVRLRERGGLEVPPDFALRRGWGSPTERAMVFLALLEQLGDPKSTQPEMAGCLLQVPDQSGRMHLWACGVVVGDGKNVYLFDPRLGLPLSGPKGEGVTTLAAVQKDSAILAQLKVSAKHSYDVTPEQARAAQAQLVYPLSSLSPRMRYLQDQVLPPAVRVRLAVDPVKEFERVASACANGAEKTPVRIPKERVAVMRQFLPPEEGGVDTGTIVREGDPRKLPRKVRATIELIPRTYLPPQIRDNPNFPRDSVLGERVQQLFASPFIRTTLDAGQSRDLLLRGRYTAAEPELVSERERWREQQKARAAAVDLEKKVDEWMDQATHAYAALLRAGPAEREAAERNTKQVWDSRTAAPIYVLLFSAVALVRNPDISYQLGLCSQEQAEQLQARLDLQTQSGGAAPRKADVEKSRQAWQDALSAWKRYEEDYPRHPDVADCRRLRGRAESMLGDWQAAVATWKKPTDSMTDLEKLATLYLAQQLEKQHAK
ncbi:MAG TPA: hypothetical protein VH643_41010 [Gemmataceae bacterium]|jgi:hypothetical protein